MDQLELQWQFDFGKTTERPDQPLVLARALRAILEEGRPQGAIRLLFMQPNLERSDVYWFGALLLSDGDRVLFFPPAEISGFELYHSATLREPRGFEVDHVTLEPDRRGWHMTGVRSRRRMAGPQTVPLASGGFLWFGMSSAEPGVMPPVYRENEVHFEVPATDARRRLRLLKSVRDGAVDQIISLNAASFRLVPPWYVQFNFAVGPPGFGVSGDEIGRVLVNPSTDPTGGRGRRFQTHARYHRVRLSPDLEVLIVSFPVLGEPTERWALMAWA